MLYILSELLITPKFRYDEKEVSNLVDVKHKMKEDEQKVWNIKKCHYITTTKNSYGQNHEDKEKNHDSQEK